MVIEPIHLTITIDIASFQLAIVSIENSSQSLTRQLLAMAHEASLKPSQVLLPMHRIESQQSTTPSSEEWQIFDKLEGDEGQSGQSIDVSVPQEKFHNVLESSRKLVVEDIPEIIKDMDLETVCIEKDGQYIDCYKTKGE